MPPPGTTFRRVRMPDELWNDLEKAAKAANPDLDRSKVLRLLARWYIGEIDELPQRPDPAKWRTLEE